MLATALRALRNRRGQAGTLLAIAALIAAAAFAAPLILAAAVQTVARQDVLAAPAGQRLLSGTQDLTPGAADPASVLATLHREGPPRGFVAVAGYRVRSGAGSTRTHQSTNSPMAYRDDLCAHVSVLGRCPDAPGTALVSARTAADLGVRVGDQIQLPAGGPATPPRLTVSGLYRPRDPAEPYWGAAGLLGNTATGAATPGSQTSGAADAVFVSADTLLHTGAANVTVTYDLVLQPAAVVDQAPSRVAAAVADRYGRLRGDGFQTDTGIPTLMDHIAADQRLILIAVPLVAGQVVVLGWFALFLAVTATAATRRADVGLLKLRGLTRRRVWLVIGGQSALPLVAGAPLGAVAGFLLARGLAGGVSDPGRARLALAGALGALVVAIVGAVLAAALAERGTIRTQVADLLRRARSRRRGARADVADLILVVVAAAGVYQVHANAHGQVAGIVVLAPGLFALAAGLVAARLLVPVAAGAVRGQLRAGRLRGVLTAMYLARRSGLDRVFALIVIAATLAGYAACAWDTARVARTNRAAQQVGADRVLTVLATTRTQLLTAVRAADPTGRYAMAATRAQSQSKGQQILTVDSTRLAAVAGWVPGYGLSASEVARLLRPPVPAPVTVAGGALTLDVTTTNLGRDPVFVLANLVGPDGQRTFATFGPVHAGRQSYAAQATACTGPGGCRLTGFQLCRGVLAGGAPLPPPAAGPSLVLHRLAAGTTPVLTAAQFGDRTRWRATQDPAVAGPILASAPDGLLLGPPQNGVSGGTGESGRVYLIDAPPALPLAVAGTPATGGLTGDPQLDVFGSTPVPVTFAAHLKALPRLGANGVLADLEYADRIEDDAGTAEELQVWLAAGAPTGLPDRLRAAGLTITGEQREAEAGAQIDAQGPQVALRFQVAAAVIGLLLAAGSLLLLAAADREPRAAELVALRVQGLSTGDARAVTLSGYALLAGCGAAVGAVAAVADRLLAGGSLPLFSDGWTVLAPPPMLRAGPLLIAVAGSVVVLGVAAAAATYQLISVTTRPLDHGRPRAARS